MKPIRIAVLVSMWLATCVLDDSTPKNRCTFNDDCLVGRVCLDGVCHDRTSPMGGTMGGTHPTLPQGGATGAAGSDAAGGSDDPLGGSGGDAGASGGNGGEADAGAAGMPQCPEPPRRVKLPAGFCIDPHEVTRGAYDAWLDLSPAIWTPPGCENNDSLEPSCTWVTGTDDLPANCVDWCDAAAYCQAHDARLCAKIGGGSSSFDEPNEPSVSEWFNACSSDGRFGYPYGDRYAASACNTESTGTERIGESVECRAPTFPYACVYGLSGNVREWEDACDGDIVTSRCRIRGGSYALGEDDVACTAIASYARTTYSESIGFRCCSDTCD